MKLFSIALLSLFMSLSAFAGPSEWTYFDGKSRVIAAKTGWVQLESNDKAYCNGRVRLYQEESDWWVLNPADWILEIQGSWCHHIKVGYNKTGDTFNEKPGVTKMFNLRKYQRSQHMWSGYGLTIRIPDDVINEYSNSISKNHLSFVLYTDQREDTKQQAYEKLTLFF
jgi:hypothetical protein